MPDATLAVVGAGILGLAAAGALAGSAAGAAGALVLAILQLVAKRLRNAALVRRGEPPYRDVIFTPAPFVVVLGGLGALAGALTAALVGAWWPAAALAGAAAPVLLTAVVLVATAVQALGSPGGREPPSRPPQL